MTTRIDNARTVRAARGTERTAKSWLTEAPLRMLMNNLDPEVAERPADLVVYGGTGKAARNWNCFHAIVRELERDHVEGVLRHGGEAMRAVRRHRHVVLLVGAGRD